MNICKISKYAVIRPSENAIGVRITYRIIPKIFKLINPFKITLFFRSLLSIDRYTIIKNARLINPLINTPVVEKVVALSSVPASKYALTLAEIIPSPNSPKKVNMSLPKVIPIILANRVTSIMDFSL